VLPHTKDKPSYDIINVGKDHLLYVNDILVHNCDFQQSGSTVIEPEDITFYEENYICDPIEMVNELDENGDKLNKSKEMWY